MACVSRPSLFKVVFKMTIEVVIAVKDQDVRDVLIAMLSEIDFHGFGEEEDVLKAFVAEENYKEEELN
ncbi:MAG TPA: hypothetical protein VF540_03530, partial [Segetibacter sp.]